MKRCVDYGMYFSCIKDVIGYDAISLLKSIICIDLDISMINSNIRINNIPINERIFNKINDINKEFENSGLMALRQCRIDVVDMHEKTISVDLPFEIYMSVMAYVTDCIDYNIDYMMKNSNEKIVRIFDKIINYVRDLKDDVFKNALNFPQISISLLYHGITENERIEINKWFSISRFKELRDSYISSINENSNIITVVMPNSLFRKIA